MSDSLKVLGQIAPAATTETDLYTVPAATQTTVSSIVIANRDSGAATQIICIYRRFSNCNKRLFNF